MKNVSGKSCRENQNTHFMFSNFFSKILKLLDNVEKYFRVGQATDDNMAHAHCMLEFSAGVRCHHCSFQPVYTGMHTGKLETMVQVKRVHIVNIVLLKLTNQWT
jgi:hypothetical protein